MLMQYLKLNQASSITTLSKITVSILTLSISMLYFLQNATIWPLMLSFIMLSVVKLRQYLKPNQLSSITTLSKITVSILILSISMPPVLLNATSWPFILSFIILSVVMLMQYLKLNQASSITTVSKITVSIFTCSISMFCSMPQLGPSFWPSLCWVLLCWGSF